MSEGQIIKLRSKKQTACYKHSSPHTILKAKLEETYIQNARRQDPYSDLHIQSQKKRQYRRTKK
jgi:hypothetical protein